MTSLALKHAACGSVLRLEQDTLTEARLVCPKCEVEVPRKDRDPPHSVVWVDGQGRVGL